MDLRHLRYFLAVADEGHFGRAAQRLHIVQPALSMQIRALEEELGAPLFVRTSRRVDLTEAGELFRIEAERTIAQAERAKLIFQRAARGEIGSVQIGFAGTAAFAGRLSSDLRAFHAAYPEVELNLLEIAPQLQAEAILQGQLDIGYSPAYGFTFDAALVTERIASWPWLIAMSADHPLARADALEASELREQTFILYAAHELDTGQLVMLRRLMGAEPRVGHRVANTLTVLAMAAAGLGIALVPQPLGEVRIPNVTYRPLLESKGVEGKGAESKAPSDLLLISRASETSPAVNAFLQQVRNRSEA